MRSRAHRLSVVSALIALALVATGCATTSLPSGGATRGVPSWLGPAEDCARAVVDPAAPDVAATEAIAMPHDDFWALISLLDGGRSRSDYARLTDALAMRTLDDWLAFDARLALLMYALDDECRYTGSRSYYGYGDDGFVYARASVVAAGQEVYEDALDALVLPPLHDDDFIGEWLLYVAWDASLEHGYEEVAYLDIAFDRITISYETGSNPTGWAD